jgi:hypothetical protein
MTMMMKAPALFGYIAVTLVALGLIYLAAILVLAQWWTRRT